MTIPKFIKRLLCKHEWKYTVIFAGSLLAHKQAKRCCKCGKVKEG